VLLKSENGRNIQHDALIPRNADIARFQVPLSAHSIGSRCESYRGVLIVFEPRARSRHLEMPNVKVVRDIARERVVSIESDAPENLVVMAGQLALGDNHGHSIGGIKDLTGDGCIIDAFNENVSLGTQSGHGSNTSADWSDAPGLRRQSHWRFAHSANFVWP
jgi:hypothetical protein